MPSPFFRRRNLVLVSGLVAGGVVALACVPDYSVTTDAGATADASNDATRSTDASSDTMSTLPDADATAAMDADGATDGGGTTEAGTGDASGLDAQGEGGTVEVFTISPGAYNGWMCATHAGTLYCWGDPSSSDDGEFGFYADSGSAFVFPTPAPTSRPFDQVKIGWNYLCYRSGGAVYCRGDNGFGQLGTSTGSSSVSNIDLQVAGLPAPVALVTTGVSHACGLLASSDAGFGNVYCWGDDELGELAYPPDSGQAFFGAQPVQMIADGGAVVPIHDAVTLATGDFHNCMIRASGQILCWGLSTLHATGGPLGPACSWNGSNGFNCQWNPAVVPLPASVPPDPPVELALGGLHSCALTQSGKVYCWGANYYGQLGAGNPQPACDVEGGPPPAPGASACSPTPVLVQGLPNKVVHIVAGEEHTCALDEQQIAYCWGTNMYGELGNNSVEFALSATVVPNPADLALPFNVQEIAAGDVKTCGKQDGAWYCWGDGVLGTMLPDGSVPNQGAPAPVDFP